jgi:hypothetical protein
LSQAPTITLLGSISSTKVSLIIHMCTYKGHEARGVQPKMLQVQSWHVCSVAMVMTDVFKYIDLA